jgi:putative intracellular protease/amidase
VADKLQGKRIAFIATDMVEQVELTEPWKAVTDEGAKADLVSLEEGEIQGFNHYDKADKFKVHQTVEEAQADDYDALVVPGGVGNPDTLRMDENAEVGSPQELRRRRRAVHGVGCTAALTTRGWCYDAVCTDSQSAFTVSSGET